jgi:fucose permease
VVSSSPTSHVGPAPSLATGLQAAAARTAPSVFFLVGLLMALPGAILPVWGYHIRHQYTVMGAYFLAMNLGLLLSGRGGRFVLRRRSSRFALVLGCALASLSFVALALSAPPVEWYWRAAGIVVMGFSAGILSSAAFRVMTPVYEHDPAAAVNLSGVLFGFGSLTLVLLAAGTFYIYTVPSKMILAALIPGFAAGLYARSRFAMPPSKEEQSWRDVWRDIRSPGAVLFSLLLFFQTGNEWSVAGWLAIFLIQRLGVSPSTSLLVLAAYWTVLLLGRVAAQGLLPRIRHGRLLIFSAASALAGCVILTFTNNLFGAGVGISMLAGGFSMTYPLVVEKIGHRFPSYHPGFYNGLFSLAVTGGLLAPWTLGYLVDWLGIQFAMIVPMLGTFMVLLLVVLLWAEVLLTGTRQPD